MAGARAGARLGHRDLRRQRRAAGDPPDVAGYARADRPDPRRGCATAPRRRRLVTATAPEAGTSWRCGRARTAPGQATAELNEVTRAAAERSALASVALDAALRDQIPVRPTGAPVQRRPPVRRRTGADRPAPPTASIEEVQRDSRGRRFLVTGVVNRRQHRLRDRRAGPGAGRRGDADQLRPGAADDRARRGAAAGAAPEVLELDVNRDEDFAALARRAGRALGRGRRRRPRDRLRPGRRARRRLPERPAGERQDRLRDQRLLATRRWPRRWRR